MTSRMNFAGNLVALIVAPLVLAGTTSCSSPTPAAQAAPPPQQPQPQHPNVAQLAAQQVATVQQGRAQEQEFVKGLEAAVVAEPRNDAWAKQKETGLRKFSPPMKGKAAGTLKSVECRTSKCMLRFQVSADPKAAIEQQAAINYWVAANEPCEYTVTTAPDATKEAGLVRVFLNCAPR